jgi:hypothetical protein
MQDWCKRYIKVLLPKESMKLKLKIRRNIFIKNEQVSLVDRHINLKNINPKNISEINKSKIKVYCIKNKLIQQGDSTIIKLW